MLYKIDWATLDKTFIVPTMQNGWVVFSNSYEPARYYKDALGFVHLDGVVKSGSANSVIFVLPPDFRPNKHRYVVVGASGAAGICEIMSTGEVYHKVGSTASFSLNGITFPSGF